VAVLEQITDTLVDKILLSGEKIKRAVAAGLIADTKGLGTYTRPSRIHRFTDSLLESATVSAAVSVTVSAAVSVFLLSSV